MESMPRLEMGPYMATSAGLASVEAIDACAEPRSGKRAKVAWAEVATKAASPTALTGTRTRSRRAARRSSDAVPVSPALEARDGAAVAGGAGTAAPPGPGGDGP